MGEAETSAPRGTWDDTPSAPLFIPPSALSLSSVVHGLFGTSAWRPIDRFALYGWTVDTLTVVARLADRAIADEWLSAVVYRGAQNSRARLARRLVGVWEVCSVGVHRHRGEYGAIGLVDEVRPWICLLAAAPTHSARADLTDLLVAKAPGTPERLARWLDVGEHGSFAYAAGLSAQEAQVARAAGTLDPSALRALAGLRGWPFPPVL